MNTKRVGWMGLGRHMVRLARERRAAIGVMFAAVLIPLMGFIALSIDYGMRNNAATTLQSAGDSAALVAATTAASAYQNNQSNWQALGQTAGTNFFNAQVAGVKYLNLASTQVTVAQDASSQSTFNATLSYGGSMKTVFGQALGITKIAMSGQSSATTTLPSYVDFHIMMDNSSSMLIGATQTDMTNLTTALKQNKYSWGQYAAEGQSQPCAFACHFSNVPITKQKADGTGSVTVQTDFYGVAQVAGIKLRLNVVQDAVVNALQQIAAEQPSTSLYQVGLYSFNNPAKNNLIGTAVSPYTIYSLGTDFTAAESAAQNLSVPLTYDNGFEADTDIAGSMSYVNKIIPQTDGSGTASNHKQYLFLVTDGVIDYTDSSGNRHGPSVFDPSVCTALKNRNVQVYVLYTVYIPIPTNDFYNQNVASFAGATTSTAPSSTQLEQNLKSCASSTNAFFEATDSNDINNQMNNMLQAALGQAGRLTH